MKTYIGAIYVLALLLLLSFLAVLQYRWTAEASLAEQQRMQVLLNETLAFMERSFDREISLAALNFWRTPQFQTVALPQEWRNKLGRTIAEDYQRWLATARHPRMIRQLLIAENQGNEPLLWQFNPMVKSLQPAKWLDDLTNIRELLIRHTTNALTEEDIRRWGPQGRHFLFPFCTIPSIPAFVSSQVVEPVSSSDERLNRSAQEQVRFCLIVCLDMDYLIREMLPSLAQQYLSSGGEVQYDYLVRTRERPQKVLFASSKTNPQNLTTAPDASVILLQLRLEESTDQEKLRRLEDALDEPIHAPGGAGGREPANVRPGGGILTIDSPSGVPGGRSSDPSSNRLVQDIQGERLDHREVVPHQIDALRRMMEFQAANGWQLLVWHRAGSLQAAVALIRQRNLYVSFGILLVLATSLVVFAVAVRRARHLARQQVEFVASISHELRTPVTAICSLSENLADGVVRHEDQVRRYGQFILREGRRLGGLVEQALEFAGIGSGRRRNHMQPIAVAPVLREAVQSCEASLQEGKARMEMRINPDLPQIMADAESLRCAVQNLISNAIKYSPGEAIIELGADYSDKRRQLEISVADKGMGIPQKEISRIFEPFFRGRKALDLQIRGAGIGLSLVKKIVDLHHGQVQVSSPPGKGTCVVLCFPVLEASAQQRAGMDQRNHSNAAECGDCHGKDTAD